MEKTKVLLIITRLNIGGPSAHTALLAEEFNKGDFESLLLHGAVSKGEGDMGYLLKPLSARSLSVPFLQREINPLYDLIAFWRIFKCIKKYKPHIVHTHTAKAGALGRAAAILAGVPLKVHTFHGNIFEGYFNKFITPIFILIEKILAKFTDRILVISETQKHEITHKYKITSPNKCRIIKLGFDLSSFLSDDKKSYPKRLKFDLQEDILIGSVGRLTPIKNHKMLIDAASYMKSRSSFGNIFDKIKFIIIGDGELKNELLKYAENKGVKEKVIFAGWEKSMSEVYRDLDIVALTSINEGTPVSLIESMASSKPIVATDVGGVKDTLGGSGLLVKSGDYKDMGDKLFELSQFPEKRDDLGRRGREFVKDAYSKERLIKDVKTLYKDLMLKKKKRGAL